jgi:hypothetical protein
MAMTATQGARAIPLSAHERRRIPEAAADHIKVQGEIVYATASLQDAFFELFRVTLSLERPDKSGAEFRFHDHALTIWHVIQSDSSQRQMAVAALSTVPTALPAKKAIASLRWANNRSGKLAEYRNIVAHNPVVFRMQLRRGRVLMLPEFGGQGTREPQRRRLRLIEGLTFWRSLRDEFLDLAEYVRAIVHQVRRMDAESRGAGLPGASSTWPRRPRQRLARRLEEIAKTLAPAPPATRKAARRRRRKPFPALRK